MPIERRKGLLNTSRNELRLALPAGKHRLGVGHCLLAVPAALLHHEAPEHVMWICLSERRNCKHRVGQLNFTPKIEVFYMLFDRSHSIKQHMEYFNFGCSIHYTMVLPVLFLLGGWMFLQSVFTNHGSLENSTVEPACKVYVLSKEN